MKQGRLIQQAEDIQHILKTAVRIAIVGLSPNPDRASYRVAEYLQARGYQIIPVRPGQKEILGEPAYASLSDIPTAVDIVDVFRRSSLVPPHAEEAIRIGAKVFWMQEGVENHEAALRLAEGGIDVVMNRCIKIAHETYIGK